MNALKIPWMHTKLQELPTAPLTFKLTLWGLLYTYSNISHEWNPAKISINIKNELYCQKYQSTRSYHHKSPYLAKGRYKSLNVASSHVMQLEYMIFTTHCSDIAWYDYTFHVAMYLTWSPKVGDVTLCKYKVTWSASSMLYQEGV